MLKSSQKRRSSSSDLVNLFDCKFVFNHVVTGSAHDVFTAHLSFCNIFQMTKIFIMIYSQFYHNFCYTLFNTYHWLTSFYFSCGTHDIGGVGNVIIREFIK